MTTETQGGDGLTIPEKKLAEAPEFVDATDDVSERAELERPKQGSYAYIIHKAAKKRYVAVRPAGTALEKMVAKTQKSKINAAKKGAEPEQVFEYATRYREAWAVMYCLHMVDPATKGPGKPLYPPESRTDQNAEKLVKQPYEVDGLLNDVGARLVKWLNDGTPFDAAVEEAKAD